MRPRCILIVDGDLAALTYVAACIRRMFVECQVAVATNGTVAKGRLRERPFDLALISYELPGMNGLDLVQFVHRFSLHTRIVPMTDRFSRIELHKRPSPTLASRSRLEAPRHGSDLGNGSGITLKPLRKRKPCFQRN